MADHLLSYLPDGPVGCSCGRSFHDLIGALDHALPLTVNDIADAVHADPVSPPEMIARADRLVSEVNRLRGDDRG